MTPLGAPLTESEIVWAAPETVTVFTLVVIELPPRVAVPLVGESAREKALTGAAVTFKVIERLWLPELALPVTATA